MTCNILKFHAAMLLRRYNILTICEQHNLHLKFIHVIVIAIYLLQKLTINVLLSDCISIYFFFSDTPILDLPDLPLIRIFYFLELEDLLLLVNRVCRRFQSIIRNTPILWTVFEFFDALHIREENLPYILKHSCKFSVFNFAYSGYSGSLAALDYLLVINLSRATNLTCLNLSGSIISTTSFLQFLPNLELLDLSQCQNLQDQDFHVVSFCHKLDNLYLSFNEIKPSTIISIVTNTQTLEVLDICGIYLKLQEIKDILDKCYWTLLSLYLTLDRSVEEYFHRQIYLNYIDLNYHIYKELSAN